MELIRAKKSLGQNFLVDNNISKKIVDLLELEAGDIVLEIGPGTGALTQFILEANTNAEIEYTGVELDSRAINSLKSNYKEFADEYKNKKQNINIVQEDFLKFDLYSFCKQYDRKVKIIGNIPYNISSPIFFKLFELSEYIDMSIIMIQKELGKRIVAPHKTKDYGILTIATGICGKAKLEINVPRTCFVPAPNVDSAVLKIKYFDKRLVDFNKFQKMNRAAFNQRRKMLSNSLKKYLQSHSPEFYKYLIELNYNDFFNKRPEQLSIEDFIDLYNHISQEAKSFKNNK